MATKTLDRYTKAELLAHLREQATILGNLETKAAQLLGDKARLRDENEELKQRLARLETRRKYENAAHVAKRRERSNSEPRAVSPARAAMDKAREEAMRTGKCVPVQLR